MKLYNSKGAIGGIMNKGKVILKMMDYQGNSIDFISTGETKETRVVATYNVTSTGSTQICSATTGFTSMEVDGVEITAVTTGYTFSTTGEHTVKFTLKDNTTIGEKAFRNCKGLTSVTIPDSVTSIAKLAFYGCTSLSITYTGTVAQWKAITLGTDWHNGVAATKVTCSDGEVTLE